MKFYLHYRPYFRIKKKPTEDKSVGHFLNLRGASHLVMPVH